jgi:hypothetical protein
MAYWLLTGPLVGLQQSFWKLSRVSMKLFFMKYSCKILTRPSYCSETEFIDRFWGRPYLECTGGNLLEEPASEIPRRLFYFCSVRFIQKNIIRC